MPRGKSECSSPSKLTSSDFATYLVEALRDSSVQEQLKKAFQVDYEKIADIVAAKTAERLKGLEMLLKAKDAKITEMENKIKEFENKLDEHEQYSRRTSIRISGMKETKDENLIAKTKDILSTMDISEEDINRMHRVGPAGTPNRQILLQFTNYTAKRNAMHNRKKLKTKAPGIFINEDLTRMRSKIMYEARKKKKEGLINDAWTYDGRMIIKEKNGKISTIVDIENLNRLCIQNII